MSSPKEKPGKKLAILDAALDLIAENGFHQTPISLIAKHAGVGAGTIYRYFRDKDDLIHALFEHVEGRLKAAILKDYDSTGQARTRFFHLWTSILVYLINNPKEFKFLEQYYNSPYGIPMRRQRLLAEGSADGKPDPVIELFKNGRNQRVLKNLALSVLFDLSIGPLVLLMRDYNAGFVKLETPTIRRVVKACWDAVKR